MRLILGGAQQGKTSYVQNKYGITPAQMANEQTPLAHLGDYQAVNHLHLVVQNCLNAGRDPIADMQALAQQNPHIIFICNEVGCGVIPMQKPERDWREAVGRVCCALAAQAQSVERVFCGIATALK